MELDRWLKKKSARVLGCCDLEDSGGREGFKPDPLQTLEKSAQPPLNF